MFALFLYIEFSIVPLTVFFIVIHKDIYYIHTVFFSFQILVKIKSNNVHKPVHKHAITEHKQGVMIMSGCQLCQT